MKEIKLKKHANRQCSNPRVHIYKKLKVILKEQYNNEMALKSPSPMKMSKF